MAGRPPAPQTIVIPNQVVLPWLRNEVFNMSSLFPEILEPSDCLQWLARRCLIRNSYTCPTHHQLCNWMVHGESIDGKRWRCQMCNMQKSVRDGSFFSGSHLTLKQVIILMYCWSHDMASASWLKFRTAVLPPFCCWLNSTFCPVRISCPTGGQLMPTLMRFSTGSTCIPLSYINRNSLILTIQMFILNL